MEYEPQTLDPSTMQKRLDSLDSEFFALAKVINIISGNTEMILHELEQRIANITENADTGNCTR